MVWPLAPDFSVDPLSSPGRHVFKLRTEQGPTLFKFKRAPALLSCNGLPACLPACLFRARRCCFCFADASSQQHTFKLRAHDERDLCSSSSSSSDENLSSLARLQSFQARTGWLSDTGRRLVQTPSRTCQPRQALPAADSTDYRRHRDQQPSNGLLRARPSAVVLLLLAGGFRNTFAGVPATRFSVRRRSTRLSPGSTETNSRRMDSFVPGHQR